MTRLPFGTSLKTEKLAVRAFRLGSISVKLWAVAACAKDRGCFGRFVMALKFLGKERTTCRSCIEWSLIINTHLHFAIQTSSSFRTVLEWVARSTVLENLKSGSSHSAWHQTCPEWDFMALQFSDKFRSICFSRVQCFLVQNTPLYCAGLMSWSYWSDLESIAHRTVLQYRSKVATSCFEKNAAVLVRSRVP